MAEVIETIIEVCGEVLDAVFTGKKNSKKSTKPGCLIWLCIFIGIIIIYLIT